MLLHAPGLAASAEAQRFEQRAPSREVDEAITRTVRENLVLDNRIPSHQIDVRTRDGVVTLSGTVNNLLIKKAVKDIARSVVGVRQVEDNVELRTGRFGDHQVRAQVLMELAGDPRADAFDMRVDVDSGVVTLAGTADDWPQRHWAEQIAKCIEGVRRVENGLSVQAVTMAKSARDIAAQIEYRIADDDQLGRPGVDVRVRNGRVTLLGVVEKVPPRTESCAMPGSKVCRRWTQPVSRSRGKLWAPRVHSDLIKRQLISSFRPSAAAKRNEV